MEQLIDFALIGKRIKASRKKVRITQAQLAEKLEVSVVYMSQIETGKTKISLSRLAQIAKFLQTDPSYFLAGTAPGTNHYFIQEFNSLLSDRTAEELHLAYRLLSEVFKK